MIIFPIGDIGLDSFIQRKTIENNKIKILYFNEFIIKNYSRENAELNFIKDILKSEKNNDYTFCYADSIVQDLLFECGLKSIVIVSRKEKSFDSNFRDVFKLDSNITNISEAEYKLIEVKTMEINSDILSLKLSKKIKIKNISDGYHSFDDLYFHRKQLTILLTKTFPEQSTKSWLHHDNTMFKGMFIVNFNTPEGQYSYHYNKDYWDEFDIKEIPNSPEYDGHKPEDINRLFSLFNQKK